jgi:hypothetical protein
MPGEMPKIVKFKMPKIVESLRSDNSKKIQNAGAPLSDIRPFSRGLVFI